MLSLLLSLALTAPAQASLVPNETTDLAVTTYTYAGPDQKTQELDVAAIVEAIRKDRTATHFVWQPGWAAWKNWQEVPELAAAVARADADALTAASAPAAAPPVPGPMAASRPAEAEATLSYSVNGGPVEQLTAGEIARRVAADPSGNHLAWKAGMANWQPAAQVPEVAAAMAPATPSAAPPPTPTAEKSKDKKTKDKASADKTTERPTDEEKEKPILRLTGFNGGGEVRASVPWMYRYVAASGDLVESDPVGAEVQRARLWVDGALSDNLSARVMLEGGMVDDRSAAYAGLTGVSTGWALSAPNAYVDLHFGKKIQFGGRVGAQTVAFGANGYYDGYDNYFVGGRHSWQALAQRFGVLPMYDVGLGLYVGDSRGLWAVNAQVMNGTGVGSVDDNFGRAIIGRAELHPGAFADGALSLNAWVSGFYETTQYDNTGLALGVSGAGELRYKEYARVYGELLVGGEGTNDGTGYNSLGYHIAAAGGLPFSKGPLDRIDLVIADQAYNPRMGDVYPYGGYAVSLALNAYWNAGDRGVLMTGFGYENYIPLSEAENVLHSGVFQVAAQF